MNKILRLTTAFLITFQATSLVAQTNELNFSSAGSNYVNLNNFITEFNNSFTIEMWVKVPSGNTYVGLLYKDNGNGSWERGEKSLYIDGSGNPAFVGSWNGYIYSTQAVNDGNWHHIAVTHNGASNGKIYVDGIDRSNGGGYNSFSADNYSGSTTIYLGKPNYGESSYYFNGDMDELRIWNVELSAANILANINKKAIGTESGLVAYYDFDQGTAGGNNTAITSLVDKTANAYNGTLTNFTETGSTSNFVSSAVSISGTYAFVPLITAVSSNTTVCSGVTTNMSVTATGTSLSYQWYRNGVSITGQTFATVTLTSALTTAPGTFSVVVSNSSGTVTSSGISLNIGCNNALQFNGNGFTGPYVNVNTNSNDFNLATFTFEAWINPTTGSNGNQTILSKGGGNGGIDNSYIFQVQSGTLQFYNSGASASPYWFNSGVSIPNNTWTHVAASYDNTMLRLFVNGVNIYSTNVTFNLAAGTNDFYIGQQGYSCVCNKFYGQIDEVRAWNIALSGADIQANMFKSVVSTLPGLVASYSFNQGTAGGSNTGITTLTDVNKGLHNGTLNSFSLSGSTANWISSATTIAGSYVFVAPSVAGISASTTVCSGVTIPLSVTAIGSNLTYQWLKNGNIISGATSSSLTLTGVTSTSVGVYSVAISSLGGNITSSGISLGIGCNNALNFGGYGPTDILTTTSAVYSSIQSSNQFTGEAWIYPTDFSGGGEYKTIMSDYNGNGFRVILRFENGQLNFLTERGSVLSPTTLSLNQWYHIACVMDQTSVRIYINGVLNATGSASGSFTTLNNPWYIGASINNLGSIFERFAGNIDEVRVWNSALSINDIQANLYKTVNTSLTGLLLAYNFNQGIASGNNTGITTITDFSGNNRNGALANFPMNSGTENLVSSQTTITGNYAFTAPLITGISSNQTVCSGVTLPLSVTATGSSLTYQWYKNGTLISGVTASTLTLTSVTSSSTGVYSVAISSLGGSITSSGISLGIGCNNALNFDGVDDYALVSADIPGGDQFTFSTWFNASTASNNKILSSSGSLFEVALVNSNQVQVYTPYGDGTGGNIALNTWNHLAAVYNNPTMTVYLNGSVIYTFLISGPVNTISGLRIGRHFSVTYLNYVGLLDEMSFWNIALSQTDIQSLMSKSIVPSTTGLTAYYNFNQGLPSSDNSSVTILNDVSNNSRSGTLSNFTLNGSTSNFVTSTVSIAGTFGFTAISITGITSSQTVCPGLTVPLNVTISGASGAAFQWYKNGATVAGATVAGLTLTNVTSTSAGVYSVAISSLGGNITSSGISLGVGCNNALAFNGNPNNISIPFTSDLQVGTSTDFTLEAWIKYSGSASDYTGIVARANGSAPFYQLCLVGNRIAAEVNPGSMFGVSEGLQGSTSLNDNIWHHVAMVASRASQNVKLYVDGNIEVNATNAITAGDLNASVDYLIGSDRESGIFLTGSIDEVRIWHVALSQQEIQNNRFRSITTTVAGLIANYDFNQGIAGGNNAGLNYLTDKSGNNRTGTLNSFSLSGTASNWITATATTTTTGAFVPSTTIISISSSQTVCSGVTLPLSVTATGTNLSYQWLKNGNVISGATSFSLTLTGVTSTSAGVYSVAISGLGGNITSSGIAIGVGCNNALNFDGTDDYITAPNIFTTPPASFTVEFWLYPSVLINNNQGLGATNLWGAFAFHSALDGSVFAGTDLANRFTNSDLPANTLQINQWQHIAFTFSNGTGSFYKNGSLLASKTGMAVPGNWGGFSTNSSASGGINGNLDELRIWNVALSGNDILNNIYKKASGTESNLVAYYDFNQGLAATGNSTINSVTDRTSNGNNATVNNFSLNGTTSNWTNSTLSITGAYAFAVPGITGISPSQTVCSGLISTTLAVTATGTGLAYQWYKNNTSISGQNFATLTLAGITTTSGGNYFVVVSGYSGNVTSAGITLTISNPLVGINASANAICLGQIVTLSGTGASTYTFTGGVLNGIGFSPTVTGTYSVTGSNGLGCTGSSFTTITVNSLPTVSINASANAICLGQVVTLSGTGASTYTFTGGALSGIGFAPTVTGTYSVTGTNGLGCTNTSFTTITVNSLPTVGINTSANTICLGQTVTLSGTGASTYTFTGGVLNGIGFSPTVTGTYSVTGSNGLGCTGSSFTTITVNSLPTVGINASANAICLGQTVTLSGTGATTYTFTGGVLSSIGFTPTVTGTYSVTGTNGLGCTNSSFTTITVNSLPAVGINASANVICLGQAVTLSGTGASTYTFTGGVLNATGFTPTVTGTYSVTGSNGLACKNTSAITVTVNSLPAVGINASANAICQGGSVTLSGTGAVSYLWSGSITDGQGFIPSNTSSYTVTGTDALSCSKSSVITVTVNSLPNVSINASSGAVCLGNPATLSGTGALTYTFTGGVLSGIGFTPTVTGTYSVAGTNGLGCTNNSFTTITVNSLPIVGINASDNTVCQGQVVTLSGTGASAYTFTGGVLNGVGFTPTVTGTYSVAGSNGLGCTNNSLTTITVNSLPIIGINASSTAVCSGDPATLSGTGAVSYSWSGGIVDGIEFIPTITGIYTVTGTDALSCSKSSAITITVNSLPNVSINASSGGVCTGQSVTLLGIGAATYTFTGGVLNGIGFVPNATDTYTVTGTDIKGCTSTATTLVAVNSILSVGIDASVNAVCFGQAVTLSGTGATTYTFTGGVLNNVGFIPTITGTYSVTGFSGSSCSNSSAITITVNSLPAVGINASSNAVCIGQPATLSGTGAVSYSWSGGIVDGIEFIPTITGIYTVTGTDALGCTKTFAKTLTVNSLPHIDINASSNTVCLGLPVTLSGNGALNYTWTGGVLDGVGFTPSVTSDYTITGISSFGCINSTSQTVSVSVPVILGSLSGINAIYKTPFSETISITGLSPFTFSLTSGTLPQGFILNTSTGVISGSTSVLGVKNFTVSATNGSCGDTKSYSITTNKADLIVQANDAYKYPTQPFPTTYTSSVTGLAAGETLNFAYSNTATSLSGVGNYAITVTVTGATLSNYNLTVIPGTYYVLLPSGLTVTAGNFTKFYGATIPGLLGTVTGLASGDDVTVTYITNAIASSSANTSYSIYPVVSGTQTYKYTITTVAGMLTVKPAKLTIKAFDYVILAGEPVPDTFPGTITGLVPGDDVNVVNTSDIGTSTILGTYQITPEVSGEGLSNYSLIMFPGNLYVKYGLTVTAANLSKIYGTPTAAFTGTVSGLQPAGALVTVTYVSDAITNAGAGAYTVIPVLKGADVSKYEVTTLTGSFTIIPAGLTVTANNMTKKAGDPNPTFTSSVQGLVSGEAINIAYSTTADISSPSGSIHAILPIPSGNVLANYTLTTIAGELLVVSTTSPMNISAGSFSKVYGTANPAFSGTVTGLHAGDNVQINYYTIATDNNSPVGNYPLLVTVSGADAGKYVISSQQGTFSINKAPLLAIANSYSKTYGDSNPALNGTVTGLATGDVIVSAYLTNATPISDAGTYSIVPYLSGDEILSNYNITTVAGTLTIEKSILTVIGASYSRSYNEKNPVFAYNIFGFINDENIRVLDQVPLSVTEATGFSDAGTYTISFTGANDNNYDLTYINSTLTITQALQSIVGFNSSLIKVRTGETITLTGYATSGLPLSIQSQDSTIVLVKDMVVYGLSDGLTQINISQAGDLNYTATNTIQIDALSTSTGIISADVLGILGPQTVSTGGKAVTYSLPLKAGYTYLWKYTGQNIQWLSDTTSYKVQVIFTDQTTEGQVIGEMYDQSGSLVKKDGFNVSINSSPEAQLSQTLTEAECPPLVTDCKTSYISSFNFGKLVNKTNGCSQSGYGDFTAIGKVDTLLMGNSYHLVAKGYVKGIKSIYFAVWLDYGNDGSFSETDDFISASFDADTIFEIKNVVIRNNDAYKGARRMRVGMRTSGAFTQTDACMVEGISGEMEDYLVFIRAQDALEAPNIITPNNDGKNDLFIIRGINPKADNKLTILDRWGEKKYEKANYDNTWGGTDTHGSPLEEGTYYYYFTNGNITIRGYVEVKPK